MRNNLLQYGEIKKLGKKVGTKILIEIVERELGKPCLCMKDVWAQLGRLKALAYAFDHNLLIQANVEQGYSEMIEELKKKVSGLTAPESENS